MARFLCIRHAQSTMNAAGLWQGQADPPLSEAGRRQATELAESLAAGDGRSLRALVCSDLRRAAETAAIVGEALGLEPQPLTGLRELDVGAWSGRPHAEISARWPEDYERFRAGDLEVRPGGGESRRMLRQRATAVLGELAARWPGAAVGVVTHLGLLRTLRPGLALENTGTLWLDPRPLSAAQGGEEGVPL